MSQLNRVQIRTHARLLAKQTIETTALETTELDSAIAEAHSLIWAMFGPRMSMTQLIVLLAKSNPTPTEEPANFNYWSGTTASQAIEEILMCLSGVSEAGTVLEKIEYHELLELRRASEASADDTKYWCAYRLTSPTGSATQSGKWRVMVHPPVNAQTSLTGLIRQEKATLSADADNLDVSSSECYMIARIVGYELAARLGRSPDELDTIAMLLPEQVRQARGIKLHAGVGVASIDADAGMWP